MKEYQKFLIITLISIVLILAGCAPLPATDTPEHVEVVPVIHTATPEPTNTPTPQPTAKIPMGGLQTRYELDLLLDYYNHYATVKERIDYTNKSSDTISELILVIPPTNYPDAFRFQSLTNAGQHPISTYSWEGNRMKISLEAPLLPGENLTINLSFGLLLPIREGTFGYTGRQINLSNWYPFIPPWQDGKGWQVHDLWLVNSSIVGEYLVYEASDFSVNLEFTDRRENMKIAAPIEANEKDGVISYELTLARQFTFSISDIFISHQIEQDGVTILSYAFPEHTTSCIAAAEITAQALKLYGELYGPYKRSLFTVIEADFFHGMEFDGMTLLSKGFYNFYDGTPKTNLTIVTPHEISHQWFFSLVGNDQAIEPWLDESMATYNEALYYERYYPDLLQWWWDSRVYGHNPTGYVNTSIYLDGGYDAYRDGVYLRGAIFIQAIRDAIGDDAFFAALKDYVATNEYENAKSDDFFAAIARHSDVDLTPILEKYFLP